MADIADDAQAAEALHLAEAEARRRSAASSDPLGPLWVAGVPWCRECGEEIPATRIQAVPQTCRCVRCQEEWEAAR